MNINMLRRVRCWLLFVIVLSSSHFSVNANNMPAIPVGAKGLVVIESVRNGNLLRMRGWVGEGKYFTLNQLGQRCIIDSIEFIAGSFTDTDISIVEAAPVTIAVYGDKVAKRLFADEQVNSQDYQIGYADERQGAEMQVINGVVPAMTFILNPKRKWASWFREEGKPSVCMVTDEV